MAAAGFGKCCAAAYASVTEQSLDLQAVKDISRLQRQVTVEQAQATLQLASMTSGRCLHRKRCYLTAARFFSGLHSQVVSVLLQRSRVSCSSFIPYTHLPEGFLCTHFACVLLDSEIRALPAGILMIAEGSPALVKQRIAN